MLVTIDEYYDINFYLQTIQALKNNQVPFTEYILSITPFYWYINVDNPPSFVNYDMLPNNLRKYIINLVQPATPSDDYKYQRRETFTDKKALKHYGRNTPMIEADNSDYACFFNLKDKEQALELSKSVGKIWYFGKYYNNMKIALCTNRMIKNFISSEDILVQKDRKSKSSIQMEIELNYNVFRLNTRLKKFSMTPYFDNGSYKPVNIQQFKFSI